MSKKQPKLKNASVVVKTRVVYRKDRYHFSVLLRKYSLILCLNIFKLVQRFSSFGKLFQTSVNGAKRYNNDHSWFFLP